MAQNLKIIIDPYESDGTLNQVLFGDNIKIKGGSTIALTGFNGSLDIQSIEREIPEEQIRLTINHPIGFLDIVKDFTIPSKNYRSFTHMAKTFQDYLNRACGSIRQAGGVIETLVGAKVFIEALDLFKLASAVNIEIKSYALKPVPTKQGHLVDEEGYFPEETEIELIDDLDVTSQFYLLQGGGFRVEIPVNFRNTRNGTYGLDNNTFIRLNKANTFIKESRSTYTIFYVPSLTPANRRLVIQKRIVTTNQPTVTTEYVIPSEIFYDYQTIQAPYGPFTVQPDNGYFFICQRDGFVKFGYTQVVGGANPYPEGNIILFNDNLEMEWSDEFKYTITVNTAVGCKVKANEYVATLETSDTAKGNTVRENAGITFSSNSIWKKYLGMNQVNYFFPKNSLTQSISNVYAPGFFNLEQLEMALEIDAIKIENYVALKSNSATKQQGRQNILAYFTPTTNIEGSNYIYQYTPAEPIYLQVANKQDFEINRMGIRLFNTYNGKSIKAHALTFVITNK